MSQTKLRSLSLFVRDLERSLALYRDILGLEVYYDDTFTDPDVTSNLGLQGKKLHVVFLKSEGDAGMIGLFDIVDEEALGDATPEQPPMPDSIKPGNVAAVFYCSDLDSLVPRIEAAGCKLLHPPMTFKHQDYPESREMVFWDPDGIVVNLIEK